MADQGRRGGARRDELVALLGPKDAFDSHALVQGQSRHAFVAREETLCYLLPEGGRARPDPGQSPVRRVLLPRTVAQAGRHGARGGGQPRRHPDARAGVRHEPVAGVLHRCGRYHRNRRPSHERDRQQRAVRARRRAGRHHHRHEPVEGGRAEAHADRGAGAPDHPFRRDLAGAGRFHLFGADPDDQDQQAADRDPRRHRLCRHPRRYRAAWLSGRQRAVGGRAHRPRRRVARTGDRRA